jgi:hypothetical protein
MLDADATLVVTAERLRLSRQGALNVTIDGVPAGRVHQGSAEQFTVGPGTHAVQVLQNGFRSKVIAVDVSGGEQVVVAVGVRELLAMIISIVPLFWPAFRLPGAVLMIEADRS